MTLADTCDTTDDNEDNDRGKATSACQFAFHTSVVDSSEWCGTVVPPKIFSSAGVKNLTNIMSLLQQQTNKQTNKAIQLFSFVGAYPVGTTHVPSLSFNSRLCDIGARYCVASISKKSQF